MTTKFASLGKVFDVISDHYVRIKRVSTLLTITVGIV